MTPYISTNLDKCPNSNSDNPCTLAHLSRDAALLLHEPTPGLLLIPRRASPPAQNPGGGGGGGARGEVAHLGRRVLRNPLARSLFEVTRRPRRKRPSLLGATGGNTTRRPLTQKDRVVRLCPGAATGDDGSKVSAGPGGNTERGRPLCGV